jgi:hypothetical protein
MFIVGCLGCGDAGVGVDLRIEPSCDGLDILPSKDTETESHPESKVVDKGNVY